MIPLLPLLGPLLPLSYNMTNIYNTTYTIYANDTFTADSDSEWMMKQDYEQNRQKFIKMNQAIHGLLQDVLALKKLVQDPTAGTGGRAPTDGRLT